MDSALDWMDSTEYVNGDKISNNALLFISEFSWVMDHTEACGMEAEKEASWTRSDSTMETELQKLPVDPGLGLGLKLTNLLSTHKRKSPLVMTKISSLLDWFFHFCSGQVLGPYGGEGQRWSRHFIAKPREIYSELSGKRLPCYLGWISGKADYSRLTAISFHWKYVRQTTNMH